MMASPARQTDSPTVTEGVTYFASPEFASCAASALEGFEAVAFPVYSSGPPRTLNAVARRGPLGTREILLGPFGLYSSPGWTGELEQATIHAILGELRRKRTVRFTWDVRFDHEALAAALTDAGLSPARTSTHVISLDGGYDAVFSRYNRTTRNQVLRARRSGVVVRDAASADDIREYCLLHQELMKSKEVSARYPPPKLLEDLVMLHSATRLITAIYDDRLVAGGVFFHDGNSVLYWNGASDRKYSHLFASDAVIDEAIGWAARLGSSFVNLGGSIGIKSLETFKERWGAKMVLNWQFHWRHAAWSRVLKNYHRAVRICRMS
jgi:hypothetical protein